MATRGTVLQQVEDSFAALPVGSQPDARALAKGIAELVLRGPFSKEPESRHQRYAWICSVIAALGKSDG